MAETQHPQVAPCGSWASRITSDLIVADAIALSDVFLDQTSIYWIEGRPQEAGRYVEWSKYSKQFFTNGNQSRTTPQEVL